ncbi:DUF6997 domain-containing protein [Oceanobacillus halotolerans]|uniref:DUF6997 domain-containing protein n=1 Tax=Oceanobacillus halotolerans TaxID=2663380 RepID=UPI0013DAAB9D|nr:hypothetical protein [Oceanobacillus halotolerans]
MPYKIIPSLTESSLVNLGLSSGLLSAALSLDTNKSISAPATSNSTFTFHFKPHSTIQKEVIHNNGQVEIDALFVEKRLGKDILFVLEAKIDRNSNSLSSLSKHKLLYPILALAPNTPEHIEIVPVYLKINHKKERFYTL